MSEPRIEVFGRQRCVLCGQESPAGTLKNRQQFHVFQQLRIATRKVIYRRLLKVTRQHRSITITLTRRFVIRHQNHGFNIGVAVANQLARKTIANRNEIDVGLDLVLAQQRLRHHLDFFRSLHVKKWNLAIETPRAFQVNVELVRSIGHHEKQYAPAIRRVRHELLDPRDDARRSAAISLTIRIAECTIAFVDDHNHLADGANHVQYLFEITFGRADPLRTEVLQLDRREATLFREGFGDESLSRAHWTSKQNAHRHTASAAFANAIGDDEQVFLHLVHAADDFKPGQGFDKLHEAETLTLQDLALSFGNQPISLLAREFDRARQRRVRRGHRSRWRNQFPHLFTTQITRQRREFMSPTRRVRTAAE